MNLKKQGAQGIRMLRLYRQDQLSIPAVHVEFRDHSVLGRNVRIPTFPGACQPGARWGGTGWNVSRGRTACGPAIEHESCQHRAKAQYLGIVINLMGDKRQSLLHSGGSTLLQLPTV